MEQRRTLRGIASLFRVLAFLLMLGAGLLLVAVLAQALRGNANGQVILGSILAAVGTVLSAVGLVAFSELILVFVSQEEMLRHIVNELRHRE